MKRVILVQENWDGCQQGDGLVMRLKKKQQVPVKTDFVETNFLSAWFHTLMLMIILEQKAQQNILSIPNDLVTISFSLLVDML